MCIRPLAHPSLPSAPSTDEACIVSISWTPRLGTHLAASVGEAIRRHRITGNAGNKKVSDLGYGIWTCYPCKRASIHLSDQRDKPIAAGGEPNTHGSF